MRRFLRQHGLTVAFVAMALAFTVYRIASAVLANELGKAIDGLAENMAAECAGGALLVQLTKKLREEGSPQSKGDDER